MRKVGLRENERVWAITFVSKNKSNAAVLFIFIQESYDCPKLLKILIIVEVFQNKTSICKHYIYDIPTIHALPNHIAATEFEKAARPNK